MTIPMEETPASPRRLGRSVAAVLLGFVVVFVLSLGTDQALHLVNVYPPWGQPMWDTGLNLLALAYRLVYDTFGSYITARFAPHAPMRHAMAGGVLGLALCTLGAVVAMPLKLGPAWYPILLALSTLPTAWLGGMLYQRQQTPTTFDAATS